MLVYYYHQAYVLSQKNFFLLFLTTFQTKHSRIESTIWCESWGRYVSTLRMVGQCVSFQDLSNLRGKGGEWTEARRSEL